MTLTADERRDIVRRCRKVCDMTVGGAARGFDGRNPDDLIAAFRVNEALNACHRAASIFGDESLRSFDNCLRAFEGGKYTLLPDSEAFCLGFRICGMVGMMVFFENTKTWSLHT